MKKFTGVKAVAWDLDGTLIDSFAIFEVVLTELAAAHNLKAPNREDMKLNYHGSLTHAISEGLKVSDEAKLNQLLVDFIDIQGPHYDEEIDKHFFADAVALVHRLNKLNVSQILITNREHTGRNNASPRAIIANSAISHCIHEIRCGDEVAFRKPDPRSLQDWLDKHDIAANQLVVIGDQFVDAQLALNLAARSIIVKRYDEVPHLETLTTGWQKSVTLVDSLNDVRLTP